MPKADLHVHSKFSDHASDWFLKKIGAGESYTEPDFIYKTAKKEGMDFVTITDHNKIQGALYLNEKYPDTFMGVESTAYFPEDRCKIHILIYAFSIAQFEEIQRIRTDIYQLRDFIQENNLAYSVAHGMYPVNGILTADHLEKLILLFDVFEGKNGGRGKITNANWSKILRCLSPDIIEDLRKKHKIEPISNTPWQKSLTGGSDDHGGLFIGKTFTETNSANTPEEFLSQLRNKNTREHGRNNNFDSLAFTIYKIAHDFSKNKSGAFSKSLASYFSDMIFNQNELKLTEKLRNSRFKSSSRKSGNPLKSAFANVIESLEGNKTLPVEEKLDLVYEQIGTISDEFFRLILNSIQEDLKHGDLINIVTNVSASLPGLFLTLPFFTTLHHINNSRHLIKEMHKRLAIENGNGNKKVLWFSDTINDMNGVSTTMKKLGWLAYKKDMNLTLVGSLSEDELNNDIPPNLTNLPYIFNFLLPDYEKYNMKIPSLLNSIKTIYKHEPDKIIVSTPGPIGLFGLLCGYLLNVPTVGIYHTDFREFALNITEDERLADMFHSFNKWFYEKFDEIQAPSHEYVQILEDRGYEKHKLSVFDHGIDTTHFRPTELSKEYDSVFPKDENAINIFYAGRISQEKNLDFLLDIFSTLRDKYPNLYLTIAGDGPWADELTALVESTDNAKFIGGVKRDDLPQLYSKGDIFLFPANADTFGMVVLEAQACGIPSIVSDMGGPQRIIINGETGYVAKANCKQDWLEKTDTLIDLYKNNREKYNEFSRKSVENARNKFNWETVLDTIVI